MENHEYQTDTGGSRVSSFNAYMRDVLRHEIMGPEKAHEIAVMFFETRDPGLKKRIVNANLRFVVKIAFCYRNRGFPILDLIQEGNIGLMKAVEKFDPVRGYKLLSYAGLVDSL